MFGLILLSGLLAQGHDPVDAWLSSSSTVSHEPLRAARRVLDRGKPRRALSALARLDEPDELSRWLSARAWLRLGSPSRALRELKLRPKTRCLDPSDDVVRTSPRMLEAELVARTEPDRARSLWMSIGTPEALALASAAPDARRRLVLKHPGSAEAKALIERRGLPAAVALFSETADKIAFAEALLAAHQNGWAARAAVLIEKDLGPGPVERCRLGYVRGRAERKRRAYGRARAILSKTRRSCLEAARRAPEQAELVRDRSARAALLEARVLAILGRSQPLDEVIRWMTRHFPGHSYLDDALLWRSELRSPRAARAAFKEVVDQGGDQASEAAWRLARLELQARNRASAKHWLESILAAPASSVDDQRRAEFFLARLLSQTSSRSEALDGWARLAMRPSFYGFLALDRLRRVAPDRAQTVSRRLLETARSSSAFVVDRTLLAQPSARRAARWYRAGATDWAQAELRALACAHIEPTRSQTVTLALALARIGARAWAQRLLRWDIREVLEGPLDSGSVAIWRAAYSLAFAEDTLEAAKTEGFDPLLLTALAREESYFDPEVVSWAGATGLTQLMPATALGAHLDVFGSDTLDLAQLTEPSLNLRLGARVLKDALLEFQGFEAFALSAYNGGPGLTRRTLPGRRVPFEDWVEGNPVPENRGYVKRVMATWSIYRLLYGQDKPFVRLPRWIGPGPRVTF